MCKKIIYALSVVFLVAVGFYGGSRAEEYLTVKEAGKSTIGTIAVVNLDEGVMVGEEKINYATKLIAFPDTNFIMTSLADARNGVETEKYAAYIIIPGTFSQSTVSVNAKPEKANIEYAVNDNLREDIMVKVVGDINNFNLSLSSNMAYMYVSAILEEFHSAQDTADTIMENDSKDAGLVASVAPEILLTDMQFTELKQTQSNIKPIDLNSKYSNAEQTVNNIETQYNTYIEKGKTEFETVKAGAAKVTQAVTDANIAITGIDIEKTSAGEVVYEKGIEELDSVLEVSNKKVEEHQNTLKALLGTADVSILATELPDPTEPPNPTEPPDPPKPSIMDSIKTYNNEVEGKIKEIQKEVESIEVEVDKQPPTTEPTEPTTAPTEPTEPTTAPTEPTEPTTGPTEPTTEPTTTSLTFTEKPMDTSAVESEEKSTIDIEEESAADIEEKSTVDLQEDTSYIISVEKDAVPPPDEEQPDEELPDREKIEASILKINETLASIKPIDIKAEVENIEKEVMAIPMLKASEVTPVIQQDIIAPIQEESKKEAVVLANKTDNVKLEMDTYEKALQQYDPLKYVDYENINSHLSNLNSNIMSMESEIDKTNSEYLEEVGQIYTDTNENITALQKSMDTIYETTGKNIINTIDGLKESRNTINKQNVIILSDLTQKLPYTRLGSVEFTEAYDFIVNPISVENKGSNVTIQVKQIQNNPKDRVQILLVVICAVTGSAILILLTASQIQKGKREEEKVLQKTVL